MKFIRYIAWAWIIIVGGLMITPGGIECIRCGNPLSRILGVISILLGIAGLASELRRAPATTAAVAGELETTDDTNRALAPDARFTISDYRRGAEDAPQADAAGDAAGGTLPPRGTIPPRKGGAA